MNFKGKFLMMACMAVLTLAIGCGSSSTTSSGGTSAWTVVASSGTVVAGTAFITSDNSPSVATGGVTQGETAGDFGVMFSDTNNGWFVGNVGEALVTSDGGTSATRLNFPSTSILRNVYTMSATNVYIVGRDTVNEGASIFHTTDGGTNWTVQFNTATTFPGRSITSTDRINAIWFIDANNGWAAGGLGDNTNLILRTTDGGTTWTSVHRNADSGTDDELQSIFFADSTTGYAVGNTGVILKSTDSGATWAVVASGTTENLHEVRCNSSTSCVIVGNTGTILLTSDGGTTLTTPATAPTTANLNALDRVGAKVWAGGDSGSIFYSTDSGATWTAQTSNTTYPVQAIWMIDENTGWAACSNTASNTGAILKTTTGGS